jgi:hypothetical protein
VVVVFRVKLRVVSIPSCGNSWEQVVVITNLALGITGMVGVSVDVITIEVELANGGLELGTPEDSETSVDSETPVDNEMPVDSETPVDSDTPVESGILGLEEGAPLLEEL